MLNGYRFRLYPNREQQSILLRWIGSQRVIYNAKVQEDRYFRRLQRQMVGMAGEPIPMGQEYRRFITASTAFLRQVPSQILRNGAVKFRQAYQRFFKKGYLQYVVGTSTPAPGARSSDLCKMGLA